MQIYPRLLSPAEAYGAKYNARRSLQIFRINDVTNSFDTMLENDDSDSTRVSQVQNLRGAGSQGMTKGNNK